MAGELAINADGMFFEQRYADNSGTEFGVWLKGQNVEIEARAGHVEIPLEQLKWLRGCLARIAKETSNEG